METDQIIGQGKTFSTIIGALETTAVRVFLVMYPTPQQEHHLQVLINIVDRRPNAQKKGYRLVWSKRNASEILMPCTTLEERSSFPSPSTRPTAENYHRAPCTLNYDPAHIARINSAAQRIAIISCTMFFRALTALLAATAVASSPLVTRNAGPKCTIVVTPKDSSYAAGAANQLTYGFLYRFGQSTYPVLGSA
ncbi:hypothetical protein EV421DRAFT_1927790 [Armillaria borealis]|uniref:Uncharacterized protein n=1 Tax=Armillaria borealis TaxID=47425 RepID=A0AA39IYC0_9AGAR|nr:hypothetical protein EV421DRAFT_1927790 [Armillaria borealis]